MHDDVLAPGDFDANGRLSSLCSRAKLKCSYMTRVARAELYWTASSLASEVVKWTVACDMRLHGQIVSYIAVEGQ